MPSAAIQILTIALHHQLVAIHYYLVPIGRQLLLISHSLSLVSRRLPPVHWCPPFIVLPITHGHQLLFIVHWLSSTTLHHPPPIFLRFRPLSTTLCPPSPNMSQSLLITLHPYWLLFTSYLLSFTDQFYMPITFCYSLLSVNRQWTFLVFHCPPTTIAYCR